jgi:hypothetical protein
MIVEIKLFSVRAMSSEHTVCMLSNLAVFLENVEQPAAKIQNLKSIVP